MQESQLQVKVLKNQIEQLNAVGCEKIFSEAKGVKFGRKAILSFKEKKVIYSQHEKGKYQYNFRINYIERFVTL